MMDGLKASTEFSSPFWPWKRKEIFWKLASPILKTYGLFLVHAFIGFLGFGFLCFFFFFLFQLQRPFAIYVTTLTGQLTSKIDKIWLFK